MHPLLVVPLLPLFDLATAILFIFVRILIAYVRLL